MCRFTISLVVAVAVIGAYASRVARAEEVRCEGTITKIDGEKVTVKTATNQEQHMTVLPATKIMIDGKAAKPNDLRVGQRVKCTCNKEGDKMVCNMIEASSRAE
jgi:hypothetical protein